VSLSNTSVHAILGDATVVVVHKGLDDRRASPRRTLTPHLPRLSSAESGSHASDRDDAIRQCGQALIDVEAVDPAYMEAMLERERSISTYAGEGVAIPMRRCRARRRYGVTRSLCCRPGRRRLGW